MRLVWDLLRGRGAASVFTALDGVSFRLERGQSLAIIGENGAGKSTLLKVVASVIKPTRGTVVVNGRVGALLELGSGFHPDYTGLANIDLAAALLGLTPAQIADRREEIIAFADLGEHIREPIKHYSSGMVVRLGFAVATTLTPDILITDEVLAVGDESFQKKCIAWMESYLAGGGTLLFVSHSMYHVQKLCRHALWLEHGRPRLYGDADHVAREYLAWHEARSAAAAKAAKTPLPASAYVVTRPRADDRRRGQRDRSRAWFPRRRRGSLARRSRAGAGGRRRARRRYAGVRHDERDRRRGAGAPRSVALRVLGALRGSRASSGPLPPSRSRDGPGRICGSSTRMKFRS